MACAARQTFLHPNCSASSECGARHRRRQAGSNDTPPRRGSGFARSATTSTSVTSTNHAPTELTILPSPLFCIRLLLITRPPAPTEDGSRRRASSSAGIPSSAPPGLRVFNFDLKIQTIRVLIAVIGRRRRQLRLQLYLNTLATRANSASVRWYSSAKYPRERPTAPVREAQLAELEPVTFYDLEQLNLNAWIGLNKGAIYEDLHRRYRPSGRATGRRRSS